MLPIVYNNPRMCRTYGSDYILYISLKKHKVIRNNIYYNKIKGS